MAKKNNNHNAFFIGSWVGLLQAFLGMTVALRFGPIAAFLVSTLAYVVLYNIYKWATAPGDEDEPQQ